MKTTLKFPKNATRQHIGYIGTVGAGKTQGMMQLFDNFKNSKKILIDVKGDYTSTMQQEDDLIFCPYDKRSLGWNIFNDIKTILDIDNIVAALIPENQKVNDPYFDNAARSVLKGILIYLSKEEGADNASLWDVVTSPELIIHIVKNDKEACSYMELHIGKEEELDKQAKSVLGTMIAHIGVTLEALAKIDGDFSFKEWTKSTQDKRSIFLLGEESVLTSLLPLYRVAVEIVASELLSMPDDTTGKRELFFWLDELPKLKKVSKVIDLMTLARSKGGRVIYSIQTLKQLSEVYGKEGMYTILDTTNTLFIFRTTDANELENILGKQEVLEYSESRTWGPHDMRDGGSHSKQKKTKPLVLASDIQRLENLEFYIKSIAPDITKAKLQYIGREEKNPKFVPNIEQIQKRSVDDEDSEADESENKVSADDFMDDISSL